MNNVRVNLLLSFAVILFGCATNYSQNKWSSAETDICSLLDSPRPSESTVVKLKALMKYSTVARVDGGDTFLYSPKCNNEDYFAFADFERTKWNKKQRAFFADLLPESSFIFEIVLQGRVKTSFFPTFGHLSWSRASVRVDKIVSITDVSGMAARRQPNTKDKGPESDLARYLWTFNNEFLNSFLGISSSFKSDSDLSEDFEAIDATGRKFNRSNLEILGEAYRPKGGIDTLRIYQPIGRPEGPQLIVRGIAKIESKQGDSRNIEYESTYIRQNDFLKLTRFRILKR